MTKKLIFILASILFLCGIGLIVLSVVLKIAAFLILGCVVIIIAITLPQVDENIEGKK